MPGCVPRYRHGVPRVNMDIQDCLITYNNVPPSYFYIINYSVPKHNQKEMLTFVEKNINFFFRI
ncbi:unnamed protein product [Spodoptera exigua]|nr:unnamed protein product [Spodoptera exigua]